ncbi:MAG: SH3 domain-containing C40 family peptidase [Acidobacteriota bacterium]
MVLLVLALAAAPPGGVVLKPVANVYSVPTRQADVVSQAIYGSQVGFVEEQAGWAKVRTPDDYTGWMPLEWLRRLGPEERPYAAQGRVAQVESLFANLYGEADVTKHEPLLTVPFETRLEVIAESENEGRWIQVRLVDDRPAWVQRGDVSLDAAPLSIEAAIALSRRFLGLPYLWGGTSAFGYDCSGFVQMLCRRRGTVIPRDAGPQARWDGMAPVSKDDLQPGDLLYFGSAKRITHTGMYIGDGQFINATTHQRPMVRLDRLDDPHWTRLFVAARRLK